jgi:peptidase, S41 family
MSYWTKLLGLTLGLLTLAPLSAQSKGVAEKKRDNKFNYVQAVDVFGSSLALLDRYFVDSIDIKRLSRIGLDNMLESLDPYTEYYSAEDSDKLKLLTTGAYGGIGSVISQRPDSTVIINDPMEGMPAALAGLRAGDVILEVDGQDFRKSTSDKVSAALKGAPGSKITLLVQRPGETKPRKIEFRRQKIQVSPVSYYGALPSGYGYIALTSFPNTAASEVKKAFLELKEKHHIKGLILDLRDNGGGLIDEAIKIVNFFVPAGEEVVTTRGRNARLQETIYKTTDKPLDTEIPLTVLINAQSASSSEIVSGALQDLDRAVVMGVKSYGKGLVQTTMQLPYDGTIKLTTAKYYIPSGRCIQRIDYHSLREGKGATILPDSLTKVFHTRAGREVRDAGGILPDITLPVDTLPTMVYYLRASNDAFDWITDYVRQHRTIPAPKDFKLSDADYADFSQRMIDKKFDYDRQSSKELKKLEELARFEGYYSKSKEAFETLQKLFVPDLKHDLQYHRPYIEQYLTSAILTRYYYNRGALERSVSEDKMVQAAEALLGDGARYRKALSAPAVQPTSTASAK